MARLYQKAIHKLGESICTSYTEYKPVVQRKWRTTSTLGKQASVLHRRSTKEDMQVESKPGGMEVKTGSHHTPVSMAETRKLTTPNTTHKAGQEHSSTANSNGKQLVKPTRRLDSF